MINEKEYKLLKEAKIEKYEKYKKASDYFKANIKKFNQSMLDDLPTKSEEKEMLKINQEEYVILKEALNEGYEWITRDKHNLLCKHRHKPLKNNHWTQEYWGNIGNRYKGIDDNLLQFIQWEDEEPYNIAELIEGYEYSADHVSHVVNERVKALGKAWSESEEKEVKRDKEDLVKYLEKEISNFKPGEMIYDYLTFILKQLKQLDEPEVLSQEWIDKNKTSIDRKLDGTPIYKVREELLQNLLVPKQEEVDDYIKGWTDGIAAFVKDLHSGENLIAIEKPTIPQFVADWIVESKHNAERSLRGAFMSTPHEINDWLYEDSAKSNFDIFARAWLDGYTVKEEQKYFAKIKGHENIDSDDKYWNYCIADESFEIGDNNVHADVLDEYVLNTTKDKWENLGINDDNADFVSGEEME